MLILKRYRLFHCSNLRYMQEGVYSSANNVAKKTVDLQLLFFLFYTIILRPPVSGRFHIHKIINAFLHLCYKTLHRSCWRFIWKAYIGPIRKYLFSITFCHNKAIVYRSTQIIFFIYIRCFTYSIKFQRVLLRLHLLGILYF